MLEDINKIIQRITKERKELDSEIYSTEGLVRLQEISRQYDGPDKLIWSQDLLKEIQERPPIQLHPTGLSRLDELIGGFREQQVVTIGGAAKHGKSQWGLFLIEQLAEMNPVLIPLEQSNEELISQRLENHYSIPHFLSPYRLASAVTVDWIEERVIEGISKYNTKLVVIDHLGYIDDMGSDNRYRRENLAYRIEMIMKGLKMMAKRWNVVVVLLAHIHQADESRPPTLDDLKGSSAIKQESDIVMMLWRKNVSKNKVRVYENKTMVSVMANRRTGKNGNVGLEFDTATGRYVENHSWVDSLEQVAKNVISQEEQYDRF